MKAYDGQRQVAELIYIGSDVYFMFPGSDINHILLLAFLHLVTAFYHLSLVYIHRIIKRIQTAVAYKFHRSGNGEFQRQQVFPLIKRKLHKQAAFFDNRIVELPKERVIHFEIKMMTAVFQSCELYDELF